MKHKSLSRFSMAATPMIIVCCLLALGTSAVAEGPGTGPCSNRTLFGDYGAQIDGTLLAPNWPLRGLLMYHFDGKGGLTVMSYVVVNGAAPSDWSPGSGTYTVNPDCTGTALISTAEPPIPLHFVVVNQGKQINQVVDGNAITAVAYRVN